MQGEEFILLYNHQIIKYQVIFHVKTSLLLCYCMWLHDKFCLLQQTKLYIFTWKWFMLFYWRLFDTWLLEKTKTMQNFICLYSHVKFNRFFHYVLQYFITLNWKLKLTMLTWIISSRLIDNVKSYEMKCTDISHIQRNQSQPKRF